MTGVDLAPLERCFHGAVPSIVATCSTDGIPNVIGVSHVYRVDEAHVALSEQFTRRTRANLEQTGRAEALVVDPQTAEQHWLTLSFVRRETEGPTVTRIRARVEGMAEATGMGGVFSVRAALVCRVDAVRRVPVQGAAVLTPHAAPRVGLAHVGQLAERLEVTDDLAALAGLLLDELVTGFGMQHALLLLADEAGAGLFTLDSRGYPRSGVSSEVRLGEGLLGRCARSRLPLRVSSMSRERRYALAAAHPAAEEVPVPTLASAESLMAVPLTTREQLVGLLVVERQEPSAFSQDDELALSLVARLAAPALLRARSEQLESAATPAPPRPARSEATALSVRYYVENDSVFLDGEYLVKGVAGRILWLLLQAHSERGRTSFTNKELRMDPQLALSALNDNLEARLLLLRRRLAESGQPLHLPATGRGRFQLACDRRLVLERVETGRA